MYSAAGLTLLPIYRYFGRDTLITLRLLLPTFSATASEAILRAVIERTRNVTVPGELCHEETIGDYASCDSDHYRRTCKTLTPPNSHQYSEQSKFPRQCAILRLQDAGHGLLAAARSC